MSESDMSPKIIWTDDSVDYSTQEEKTHNKRIREIEKEIVGKVTAKLKTDLSLPEIIKWHKAGMYSAPKGFEWMLAMDQNYTPDQIIEESKAMAGNTEKEAKLIKEMYSKLEELPVKSDKVTLLIGGHKDKHGRLEFRVMARFPKESQIKDGVSDRGFDIGDQPDILFFNPSTACVHRACYDIFLETGDGIVEMPVMQLEECFQKLNPEKKFGDEYQVRDEEGVIKQDPRIYLMTALLSGYSNEFNRIRLTPFLDKIKQEQRSTMGDNS